MTNRKRTVTRYALAFAVAVVLGVALGVQAGRRGESGARRRLVDTGVATASSAAQAAASPSPFGGGQTNVAPALAPTKSDVWVNGSPTTLGAHRGKVVVLAFWTFGCINCKRTVPFWNDWAKRYAKKDGKTGKSDVVVLSVHTPELSHERNADNVRRYVRETGVLFPVVTDNESATWNAFGVRAWPTTILIDKQGRIRDRWEGELDYEKSGEYKRVQRTIEMLRKE